VTRDELEHVIRAACDIAGDDELYVFGSQAILGQFPDAPEPLRMSAEADISPKHQIGNVEALNAIGEDSPFHHQFGYYVHGLPITEAALLPKNWAMRTIPIRTGGTHGKTGHCLEAHDLAASKLAAFRQKDRDFVRVLLTEKLISPRKLIARVRLLPVEETQRERLVRWIDRTMRELSGSD
jgi:hypothetical protein